MTKAKAKAIIVSEFAALSPQKNTNSRFTNEEIKESMGKAKPSIGDLDKIKVPSGGSTLWEVLDEKGEEDAVKFFDAVIIAAQDVRVYYATKYTGGNEPPDCISLDMVNGMVGEDCPEDVTGECNTCPKQQWGSGLDEDNQPTRGKACSERKQMLLFRPHDLAPVLLSAPPTSLKEVQGYIMRLPMAHRELYYSVVTRFSLRKEKSDGGIIYSQVECEFIRALNDNELAAVKSLRATYVPAAERSPEVASE